MSPISALTTLIKRFKPRRYITLRVEFPIMLPRDCSPSEYEYLSSAEIESKALAVYTALTNKCDITPKQLRGTIVPILGTSQRFSNKIIVKCRVPEDAPVTMIRDVLVQTFKGDCALCV
mgnify:CR=1 FL=1|jgi:hypothetical protein